MTKLAPTGPEGFHRRSPALHASYRKTRQGCRLRRSGHRIRIQGGYKIVQPATPRTSSPIGIILPMAVTWRVNELVERKGWTVRQLATRTHLDIKTVRNIVE